MTNSSLSQEGGPRLPSYLVLVAAAVLLTWLIHELAHWGMGTLLGYEMKMSLNTAGLERGEYSVTWHSLLVAAAGPLVTLLQAGVAFTLLRRRSNLAFYPFLFVPFYMRLLAGAMNVINLNDEGKVSAALGLGVTTLPAIVSLALLAMVVVASRKEAIGRKLQIATVLVTMVMSSALILLDQAFTIRLL